MVTQGKKLIIVARPNNDTNVFTLFARKERSEGWVRVSLQRFWEECMNFAKTREASLRFVWFNQLFRLVKVALVSYREDEKPRTLRSHRYRIDSM